MINNLRLLILFLGIQFVSGQIPEDKAVISSIYVSIHHLLSIPTQKENRGKESQ